MERNVGLEQQGVAVETRTGFDPFFHAQFESVARAAALVTRDAGVGQELAQEAFVRLLDRWDDMASDDRARNVVGLWSPTGDRIVFSTGDTDDALDVDVMDVDGSNRRQLTS